MAAKYQKVCVCFVGGKRWESFLLAVGLCLPLRHCLLFTTTDVLDEEKFNVELIVQCIRVSEMPQTHHHALLPCLFPRKSQDLESVQEVGGSYWPRVTLILELLQHKKKLKNPQILIPTLFNLLAR